MTLIVYSNTLHPRLQYILKVFAHQYLGCSFLLTNDANEFEKSNYIKINYSTIHFQNCLNIRPQGILTENNIYPINPIIKKIDTEILFFPDEHVTEGFYNMDVFAASFFLLSRYEEYTNQLRDAHNRFCANYSIAYQYNFLNTPIVEHWFYNLTSELNKIYNVSLKKQLTFQPLATFDIDQLTLISNKNILRKLSSIFNSLVSLDLNVFFKKISILFGLSADVYDTVDEIIQLHHTKQIPLKLFFLQAKKFKKGIDINLNRKSNFSINKIKEAASKVLVGIHPSYFSNNEAILKDEIHFFNTVLSISPTFSRQHFLRLEIPTTYQNLLKNGISEDYTMGYSDAVGYRASYSHPFPFFDLLQNKELPLTIVPFYAMDVTLKNYMKLTSEKSFQLLEKELIECKKNNYAFTLLWHNESFSGQGVWKGWKEKYIELISKIQDAIYT